MVFYLALGGEMPENEHIFYLVDEIVGQLKGYLNSDKKTSVKLVVGDGYTGGAWKDRAVFLSKESFAYTLSDDSEWNDSPEQIMYSGSARSVIGEAMMNKADLMIAVWDETSGSNSGMTLEIMQSAYRKKVPFIWISSKTMKVYWGSDSYYREYNPKKLKEVCEREKAETVEPFFPDDKKNLSVGIGAWFRKKYINKFSDDADAGYEENDSFLKESYHIQNGDDKMRKALLEQFRSYDDAAKKCSGKYKALIYLRSIMPIIASIFIAIGFYAESVLGVIKMPLYFWAVVAGIGFLIHGMLNLYVYALSKSEKVKKWHKGFVTNRCIAEIYRLLLHFMPYGIHLDLKKLCCEDDKIYATIKSGTDMNIGRQKINKDKIRDLLVHIKELVGDQISYHTTAEKQYSKIVSSLSKWGKIIFTLGFILVIARAFFQFATIIFPLRDGFIGAVAIKKFASSFANMLALLIPAWASYYTVKANQNGFSYNLKNHRKMLEKFIKIDKRIDNIICGEEVPIEALTVLGEDLSEVVLLDDVKEWYEQYMGMSVKQL